MGMFSDCVSWEAALVTFCVSYCNKNTQCLQKIFSPNHFEGIGLEVPDASGKIHLPCKYLHNLLVSTESMHCFWFSLLTP